MPQSRENLPSYVSGLWLCDAGALRQLDGIIEDYTKSLGRIRNGRLTAAVEEAFEEKRRYAEIGHDPFPTEEEAIRKKKKDLREQIGSRYEFEELYQIEIKFANNKKLPVKSFAEAMNHHEVEEWTPTGAE